MICCNWLILKASNVCFVFQSQFISLAAENTYLREKLKEQQMRMIVMEEIAKEEQSKKWYDNYQMEYNKNENEEECDTRKDLIKDDILHSLVCQEVKMILQE